LVTGQSVSDVSQNVLANLAWDEVRLPNPVFEGDTIHSRSEVLSKRESHSRPEAGIVTVQTAGVNQNEAVVITFKRTVLVYKRGHGPGQRVEPGGPGTRASSLVETPRPEQPPGAPTQ
jgi:acyl dehydratase